MREREERIHQEYEEKLSVLKQRVLNERERSEQELLSARKTITNLELELAQARRVEIQPEGPVVTNSLAKIMEGECLLPGNGGLKCGVYPPFSLLRNLPSCNKYIVLRKIHLPYFETLQFKLLNISFCFIVDVPSEESIDDSGEL